MIDDAQPTAGAAAPGDRCQTRDAVLLVVQCVCVLVFLRWLWKRF